MGLYSFFKSWFSPEGNLNEQGIYLDLAVEYHIKNLAIQTCVNLIANSLIRSKFRTYEKGKEIVGNNHYLFNVKPNQNQNSSEFIHEFVSKLVYENECLVIMQNDWLYVADSFDQKTFAFHENTYSNIVVNNYKLNKTFTESEVLYFKLNNKQIKNVIDDLYGSYGKLLSSAMNYYKRSNALRVKLKMEGSFAQTDEEQENREKMFNAQLKRFLEAESAAAIPLQDGLTLEELPNLSNSGATSRDIRALADDIFDFVSMAFHIPKGLLKGDVADIEGQTDNFIMFCVAPIAELIEDEVNRKIYTKEDYLARTYFKVDTRLIKYIDIVKLANALDKLLSSGTHSVNENRLLIGDEPIDEEWANKHHITKNYMEVEEYMRGGEGK
ncbi:phage portal protein [Metabacillus halosaccharovorans]|uniref:phage portal protein n=1 Tax=Metabacillus halosaccharovorans TaxID=930124 RepID=UPI00403DF4BB